MDSTETPTTESTTEGAFWAALRFGVVVGVTFEVFALLVCGAIAFGVAPWWLTRIFDSWTQLLSYGALLGLGAAPVAFIELQARRRPATVLRDEVVFVLCLVVTDLVLAAAWLQSIHLAGTLEATGIDAGRRAVGKELAKLSPSSRPELIVAGIFVPMAVVSVSLMRLRDVRLRVQLAVALALVLVAKPLEEPLRPVPVFAIVGTALVLVPVFALADRMERWYRKGGEDWKERAFALLPRARTLGRFGAVLVVLAVLLGTANAIASRIVRGEVAGLEKEIRDRSEPFELKDIVPPPLAPDQANAADDYRSAASVVPSSISLPSVWSEEDFPGDELAAYVSSSTQAVARIAKGNLVERCNYDLDYSRGQGVVLLGLVFGTSWSDTYDIFEALGWTAVHEERQGNADRALATVGQLFRFARRFDGDPLTRRHELRTSAEACAGKVLERILSRGDPSAAACRSLRDVIGENEPSDALARFLAGDRCAVRDLFHEIRRRNALPPAMASSLLSFERTAIEHVDWVQDGHGRDDLELFARFIELARGDRPGAIAVARTLAPRGRAFCYVFRREHCAAYLREVLEDDTRFRTRRTCARLALALRVRKLRQGSYPSTLDELAPEIDVSALRDDFTGLPLVYRREKDGFALYGRGPNGQDDGGPGVPNADDVGIVVTR